jgi:hypothetical protein
VRKGLQAKSVLFGDKNAPQKRTPKQTRAPLGKCVGTASPAAVHEDYNTPGTPTHVLDERRHVESHAAELALSDGTKRTPRANYNSDGRDGWDSHGRHRIPTHRSIVVTADFSRRQTRIFQDLFCVIAHTSKDQSDRLSERALDRYLI